MKKLVFYCLICFTIFSCATQNPANFPINPYDILKVGIVPSKNKVELKRSVSEANLQMDDDFTDEIAENSNSTIDLFFRSKHIETAHLSTLSSDELKLVDTEMEDYFNKLTNNGTKNPNNFDAEGDLAIVKSIKVSDEMAVLTGYGLYGKDIPYHSTTYFFLVDADRQKLTMYNIEDGNIDPTDKNALSNQIFAGLGDYWYKK